MKKIFKKSVITKYLENNRVNELINKNGTLISPTNNYVQNRNYIKSKKTTDDFVRNSTQGPEAYFIYGGPYYGVNYTYVVSEEDSILDLDSSDDNYDESQIFGDELIEPEFEDYYDELNVVPTKPYSRDTEDRMRRKSSDMAQKDIKSYYNKPSDPIYGDLPVDKWRGYSLDYDTKFDFDNLDISESENSMRNLVDEIMVKKKSSSHDFVKRMKEQDIVGDEVPIPDITELKDVHEKPMVIRKLNSLLDLINKENLKGVELSILLNHLINNVDIYSMDERHREFIGDKLKYGEEQGE